MVSDSLTCSAYLKEVFTGNNCVVLSGPSFATDLALGRKVSIVAASSDSYSRAQIAEVFGNDNLRVYTSSDVVGVELGGVLKNIIALGVGISDGMGLGDSARAALITRGLAEMTRFAVAKGAIKETLQGLSGLGDLLMTATSDQSRNRRFGVLLGEGLTLEEAKQQNLTVEALSSTRRIARQALELGVDMPITQVLADVLQGSLSPVAGVLRLSKRPQKSEF
jgi:glycerol-3-phosphate dehydrogenase (NAD(P)+)